MNHSERQRLKQLANDSVIATFGQEANEARLAQGLEQCVDELEYVASECDHCKYCEVHGEVEDDEITIDVGEILRIHKELKAVVSVLSSRCAKLDDDDAVKIVEIIEEVEGYIDELEAEVNP